MVKKNLRKVISMVLVLLMTCSSMVFAAGGDYTGHWAEESIQNWVDKGYVRGYADGSFKPENDITRAEFISIVNRSFGFTEEKAVAYKDVKESHWAYNEFKRADAAGYIGGFEDGTLRPNAKITRQEVASIIARLLNLNPAKDSDAFLDLADVEAIPEWSVGVVSAMVDKGYMKLRSGNTFAPVSPATRAEVIAALDSSYLTITKAKYDEAGTYTAGVVEGSVEINAKDVILEDTTINGNLIIGEDVGNGDVTLNNVTVKGNTIVKGGGMDSIIIIDSQIKNLIVEKKDGKVRILAKGKTYIQKVEMKSGGKLESSDLKEDNFGDIVIAENLISSEAIILVANFANVDVKSGKNEIKILSGTIKNLLISKTAKNAKINLAEGVKVDKVEINAVTTIDGKGKIGTAIVNVNGVKITASVDKIEEAKDVDKVDTTKPSTGGGGSSSDDDSSTPSKPGTSTEAAIRIEKVSATNSTRLDIEFNKDTPIPGDNKEWNEFVSSIKVLRSIDDGDIQELDIDYFTHLKETPIGKFLTIRISGIRPAENHQSVVYSVQLGDTNIVVAEPFIVKKAIVEEIKVLEVEATNAMVDRDILQILLDKVPNNTTEIGPTALDLQVARTINGVVDKNFTWNNGNVMTSWDKATKTMTAWIDSPVEAANADQKVVYSVAYGETPVKLSNELIVKANAVEEAELTVTAVSAINGTVKVTVAVSRNGRIDSNRLAIWQSINDEKSTLVTPTKVSGKDNVLTFTIPKVEDSGEFRPVFIYVSLDGGKSIYDFFMIGEYKEDPVTITPEKAEMETVSATSAAITFTSGAAINLTTTGAAINLTTTGAAITFRTNGSITLKLGDPTSGKTFVYKTGDKFINLTEETTLTDGTPIEAGKEIKILKDNAGDWLTIYEIDANQKVLSYISIQIQDNSQK